MNNSARKDKVRSFILDVPTNSHLSSPFEEESCGFSQNFLMIKPISKFDNNSKPPSRSNSNIPDDGLQEIDPKKLDFYLKYLPYINAQVGQGKVKSILQSLKTSQTNESLPVSRKRHEVDILADSEDTGSTVFLARNKSLEITKLINLI